MPLGQHLGINAKGDGDTRLPSISETTLGFTPAESKRADALLLCAADHGSAPAVHSTMEQGMEESTAQKVDTVESGPIVGGHTQSRCLQEGPSRSHSVN